MVQCLFFSFFLVATHDKKISTQIELFPCRILVNKVLLFMVKELSKLTFIWINVQSPISFQIEKLGSNLTSQMKWTFVVTASVQKTSKYGLELSISSWFSGQGTLRPGEVGYRYLDSWLEGEVTTWRPQEGFVGGISGVLTGGKSFGSGRI